MSYISSATYASSAVMLFVIDPLNYIYLSQRGLTNDDDLEPDC
jgi:hypothetical protein